MKMRLFFGLMCLFVFAFASFPVCAGGIETDPVVGSWMLDRVYENASSGNRVELDPESAASVYAETTTVYSLFADGSARVVTNAGEGIYEQNDLTWTIFNDSYIICNDIAVVHEFSWDPEEKVFHRYWKESDPSATYHDLDFVYTRVPVGTWQMQMVYDISGAEPVLLGLETSGSLYAESGNIYQFNIDGTASEKIEDRIENAVWSLDDEGLLLTFFGGGEMLFSYDRDQDVLVRYWSDDDPVATYHALAFVYVRN